MFATHGNWIRLRSVDGVVLTRLSTLLTYGAQVVIANSARKKFVDEAAVEVYRALGVNHGASQPRCDLYKLLPYETGSQ